MDSSLDLSGHADTMLTIEDLRAQMGTCFTCGVSWSDDHVSLDCSECGGYSLSRPCPLCDGACGELWKRDFSMSHAFNKARWVGVCPNVQTNILVQAPQLINAAATNNVVSTGATNNNGNQGLCGTTQRLLAQELRARLEQLSQS